MMLRMGGLWWIIPLSIFLINMTDYEAWWRMLAGWLA